ncbi:MAG: type II secretion system protein GspE, partial [Planctomycetota bacterium]
CGGSRNSGQTVHSRCATCGGTGYRGREVICELLVIDDAIRELIQELANATAIRDAGISAGMRLLRDVGLDKVKNGITTLEEIERVTKRTAL